MGSFPHSCDTYSDRILLCPQRARPMLGKSPGSSRGGQDKNKDATHPPDSRSVFPMVCREWAASRTRYLGLSMGSCIAVHFPGGKEAAGVPKPRPAGMAGTWHLEAGACKTDTAPFNRSPWIPRLGAARGRLLCGIIGEEQRMLCVVCGGEPPGPPIRAGAGQGIHSPLQFGNVSPAHLQAPFLSSCPAGATGDVTIRGVL